MTRRTFLSAAGAVGVATLVGCGGGGSGSGLNKTVMFRLSVKGQRTSTAAKHNAANKRFATKAAAALGRAHRGDHARIVRLDTNPERWDQLFDNGARLVADLRQL